MASHHQNDQNKTRVASFHVTHLVRICSGGTEMSGSFSLYISVFRDAFTATFFVLGIKLLTSGKFS
jgi:hypothetical protein